MSKKVKVKDVLKVNQLLEAIRQSVEFDVPDVAAGDEALPDILSGIPIDVNSPWATVEIHRCSVIRLVPKESEDRSEFFLNNEEVKKLYNKILASDETSLPAVIDEVITDFTPQT